MHNARRKPRTALYSILGFVTCSLVIFLLTLTRKKHPHEVVNDRHDYITGKYAIHERDLLNQQYVLKKDAVMPLQGGLTMRKLYNEPLKTPSKDAITVGIVEYHNHVLEFWHDQFTDEKTSILHIDSHSDFGLPQHAHKLDKTNSLKYSSVGDFISVASYLYPVSNVAWIKSNWKNQQYNVGLGASSVTIGTRKTVSDKSHLCMGNFKKLEVRDSNTFLPATLQDLIPDKLQCSTNEMNSKSTIRLDVSHIEEFKNNLLPKYILDIDQDYFVAKEPGLHHLLRYQEFSTYTKLLETILDPKEFCFKEHQENDFNTFIRKMFTQKQIFLNDHRPARESFSSEQDYDLLNVWCKGPEYGYNRLTVLTKLVFVMLQQVNHVALAVLVDPRNGYRFPTISECHANGFFGVCSVGDPDHMFEQKQVIDNKMHQLERLLRGINHKPSMITISRSLDGYTPYYVHPYLETSLLEMINRIWSETIVKYAQGVEPSPLAYDFEPPSYNRDHFERVRYYINSLTNDDLKQMTEMYTRKQQEINQVLDLIHGQQDMYVEKIITQFKEFGKVLAPVDKKSNCFHIVGVRGTNEMSMIRCRMDKLFAQYVETKTHHLDFIFEELEDLEYEHFLAYEKKDMSAWILDDKNKQRALEHKEGPFIIVREGCSVDHTRYIETSLDTYLQEQYPNDASSVIYNCKDNGISKKETERLLRERWDREEKERKNRWYNRWYYSRFTTTQKLN